MSSLATLKSATSLEDLAELLGYKASSLSYILYKLPPTAKYTTFEIAKKSGGTRTVNAPVARLKNTQRQLARLLTDCRTEIESGAGRKVLSHGFRTSYSILTNAKEHKGRRYVLNFDIENFFPSFNFGRVRGFFLKNKQFELNEKIATIIAQIACHENKLPQGSPCSPIISDLIAHVLDVRLVQLAKAYKCTYSRYVDDITFSTNQKSFPAAIASQSGGPGSEWILGADLKNAVATANFSINENKTRMQCAASRQIVTGLTVNKKVNVRAQYFRTTRAMCNSLFKTGTYSWTNGAKTDNLRHLEGALSHIYHVKNYSDLREKKEKRDAPSGPAKLYVLRS